MVGSCYTTYNGSCTSDHVPQYPGDLRITVVQHGHEAGARAQYQFHLTNPTDYVDVASGRRSEGQRLALVPRDIVVCGQSKTMCYY